MGYIVFICDDNETDRKRTAELINTYGENNGVIFEIYMFSSGQELIDEVKAGHVPDMIFLDINMEKLDGIETAKQIRMSLKDVAIVLVTAYINYSLEGYKVRAVRFLVKDELEDTIPECLDTVITDIKRNAEEMEFAFVEGRVSLKLKDLIYIETNAHVQFFHTKNKTYRIYKKLDDIERELSPYGFARVHKSFVVNLAYVTKISAYRLYLSTGVEIPVPRNRYNPVKNRYALYRGGVVW